MDKKLLKSQLEANQNALKALKVLEPIECFKPQLAQLAKEYQDNINYYLKELGNMRQFDLERALSGDPVYTLAGDKVIDITIKNGVILAALEDGDCYFKYDEDGHLLGNGKPGDLSLVMGPTL